MSYEKHASAFSLGGKAVPGGGLARRRFLQMAVMGGTAAVVPVAGAGLAGAVARPAAASAAWGPEPPVMHGYSARQVKEWSPQSDRFAPYLRCRVPLARRIVPFSPAQVHPALDARPRLMVLANDYVQPGWETSGYPYGPGVEAYALRFWQYADMFGSWHGLPLDGAHDVSAPPYGLINIPNPGYTAAAHRNGVRSLGCWFWPRPENFSEVVEKTSEQTFPLADKLIEMAVYFGFDGYFINQEADIPASQATALVEMLRYLAAKAPEGFHVQWYDCLTTDGWTTYENEFNDVNSPWVVSGNGERVTSSIFLNYWWTSAKVEASRKHALSRGLDPFETVYMGQEIAKHKFSQPFDPAAIFPEGSEPRASWAYFGSEMVWETAGGDKTTIAAQATAYTRERQLWSGPAEDPSRSGRIRQPDPGQPLDPAGWDGAAHHIVEKSVIGQLPFVTRFCTGTAERFFIEGQQVSDRPWFDIGIQDLLPTWQWWVRNGYGAPSGTIQVDYDHSDAYDGGSSLRLAGALKASESAVIRLYKTSLPLTATTALSLVHRRSAGTAALSVGLVFEDAPTETSWLEVGEGGEAAWFRWTTGLGHWAGRTVATITFRLTAGTRKAEDIEVSLGELTLTAGGPEVAPRMPAGFAVDRMVRRADTASVYLSWEFTPQGVAHYDLFRRPHRGVRQWVGRTFGGAYCLPCLPVGNDIHADCLEVEAVSPAGSRSRPARTKLAW